MLSERVSVRQPSSSPARAAFAARPGVRLALILVAAFMVVLDFSIVNVALPSIERELGVSTAVAQWVVTGYAIAFGGLLILGGRAADLLGRRRMFIAGLVVFSLASLAGGLARDPVLLIASRVIQGAGAAVVAPAALSLITTSFPEGPRRTRAIGLYGSISAVGFVAGQVLGGVLIEWTSWRSVFLVNVPVGLVAVILAPRIIGDDRKQARGTEPVRGGEPARGAGRRLDVRGAALITVAVALIVLGISQGDVLGWTSPLVLGSLAASIAAGAGFVAAEARHPVPLVRPRLLLRPGLRDGGLIALLLGLWNGGEMLVLSLYLQQALHFSPLVTGLVIAPQGIAGFTMGFLAPRAAARIGVRRMLVLTGALAAAGFVALTRLPSAGYSPVLLVVVLVGLGTAGTSFGSLVIASRGMPDKDQGLVGGVINTSRQLGAAIGAALLPSVAESVRGGVSGDRASMAVAAGSALVATGVAIVAARGRVTAPVPETSSADATSLVPGESSAAAAPTTLPTALPTEPIPAGLPTAQEPVDSPDPTVSRAPAA
jgi:EmrB/QacA subfamily drug resistance transporter